MGPLSSCLSKARFACAGVLENPSLETCKLIARSWQKTDIFFPAGQADPVQPTLIKLDPSCGIAPAWEKAMKFASILQFAPVTAGCGYQANPMPAAAVPYRHRFRSHAHNTAAGGPACTRTVTGPQWGAIRPCSSATRRSRQASAAEPGSQPWFRQRRWPLPVPSQFYSRYHERPARPDPANSSAVDFTVNSML